MDEIVFLDRLDVFSLLQMVPYASRRRISGRRTFRFRYLTASSQGRRLLGVLERLGWMAGQEADYSYVDVRDPAGAHVGVKGRELDSLSICREARTRVFDSHRLVARLSKRFDRERLIMYLEKALSDELAGTLFNINLVEWFARTENPAQPGSGVFILPRTPWWEYVQAYAREREVALRGYRWQFPTPKLPWKRLRGVVRVFVRGAITAGLSRRGRPGGPAAGKKGPPFAAAVAYTGKGLTLDLSKNSDLFWSTSADLLPDQLLVYVLRDTDPIDEPTYQELRRLSIRATTVGGAGKHAAVVPTWPRSADLRKLLVGVRRDWKHIIGLPLAGLMSRGVNRWTALNLNRFLVSYLYWRWFFASFNVKLHIDHSDWSKGKVASDQAIADLGGLSISYQRSFEAFATVMRGSSADVHFCFSTAWLDGERRSRSWVGQYVSNGYVHDHAFARARGKAAQVRNQLAERGARFIVCFLDENSVDDQREGLAHRWQAEDYRYLLERLLAEPSLGLVLKPKKASTLRQRLGPVGELLDAALATGRCHLYQKGISATEALPCEASMAADVAIGIMLGSTAALESALAGTPTLLLDRETLTYHPLYALGEGRVVFQDWDRLWDGLKDYRTDRARAPGFGDWSPLLETFDTFRDGGASQRMGEYIGWLAGGLARGLSRAEAMEVARGRYTVAWGEDKIVELRNGPPSVERSPQSQAVPVESD